MGADVIFAFFGFDESFRGEAGLPAFKADLGQFLKDTKAKNYGGRGSPRVVLFSPIANEKLPDPNYPDPAANNKNIRAYAAAMAEVARDNGVAFVDLFGPSQQLYAEAAERGTPLTINGLHLTEAGDRALASVIFRRPLRRGGPRGRRRQARRARSCAAVVDRNEQWHARYRTVDGYNVYGGRSLLAFPSAKPGEKITNNKVMQEEMTQRDVLTANRDKRVWAAARGREAQDLAADDSNLPPVEQSNTSTRYCYDSDNLRVLTGWELN